MDKRKLPPAPGSPIPALEPRGGAGHQFVCYGDCCSGVPGTENERIFAAVNDVVRRLDPGPEFICFLGDEIRALTVDDNELRRQWRYWCDHEMAWLDRRRVPLYNTTSNHTTYDVQSEAIFREVLSDLPRNGPPGQEGLSYYVRRGDLFLIFTHTSWTGGGGEGWMETAWIEETLARHADARHKIVLGHHPVYPVNGFSGPCQREIEPVVGHALWKILVAHGCLAYICSHMLAFDVQAHDGVLQILTAGAGTHPLMPADLEYHHCVQAAIDQEGLRYQVLDEMGAVRERLEWPLRLPPSSEWERLDGEGSGGLEQAAHPVDVARARPAGEGSGGPERTTPVADPSQARLVVWRFSGVDSEDEDGAPQTFLCGRNPDRTLAPLWIGTRGPEHRVSVLISAGPGRSPHLWQGPALPTVDGFRIQIALHSGMGPGGVLWRWEDASPWSSMKAASSWGAERLAWPERWAIAHDQRGPQWQPFRGRDLEVRRWEGTSRP